MSQGVLYEDGAPMRARRDPAYGDNRLSFEPPPKADELLDGRSQLALVFAILAPTLGAYGVAAYGLYVVAHLIF
jgi:hypothetical protein